MKTLPLAAASLLLAFILPLPAADSPGPYAHLAAGATNAFGIDLLRQTAKPGKNALLSPYSVELALAMAHAGADGKTRAEIAKVLHIEKESEFDVSFVNLQAQFKSDSAAPANPSPELVAKPSESGAKPPEAGAKPAEPVSLLVANRIFAQSGYELRKPFMEGLNETFGSQLQELDFEKDPGNAVQVINDWVSGQTGSHIPALLPADAISRGTRVVLVNAVYLKAPWQKGFREAATKPAPFHINGGKTEELPMMECYDAHLGLAIRKGYTAVAIPYAGSQLQFLILLPDKADGLAALEEKLTPELLASCAHLDVSMLDLGLPRFKLDPAVMDLSTPLRSLGMKTAFGPGADFSRISPRQLQISSVFHKCYLSVDERGTEAAAATSVAIAMSDGDAPDDIQVDHPFLFAIQDRATGACLFLGRVTDPRQ